MERNIECCMENEGGKKFFSSSWILFPELRISQATGHFGILGAFPLDGFLALDSNTKTAALTFANIRPVYLVVKEI